MTAWVRDIYIEQGASFPLGFVLHELTLDTNGEIVPDANGNPVPGPAKDLTGCIARMQIRARVNEPTALVTATSHSLDEDPVGGQRILLQAGDVQGRVDVMLTDQDTMLITAKKAVYDLEIVHPLQEGELRPFVERVLQGSVICDLNVTRSE